MNLGQRFGTIKMHLRTYATKYFVQYLAYSLFCAWAIQWGRGGSVFDPCFVVQCFVLSGFAITLMGKRELVA